MFSRNGLSICKKPVEDMKNLVTLRPGARGTIRLVEEYGEALLFVRYRYNAATGKRYKTVELIVDEKPWTAPVAPGELLWLRIPEHEEALIECIEEHGGKKAARRPLWRLPAWRVCDLGLDDRIVPAPVKRSRRRGVRPPDTA